ncbi:zonular occludens toxin domain-containing protein [Ralstonia sp. B265]|uniref:zonular occludens toxin family protein n=1 Tax=Ralstonia sp. B265 TaxID=2836825 RepID=UPI0005732B2F|nr:zonular occludens toxin domain-containing protein [Ralstonia sp. B265]MBU6523883.1 zonular occludens toxin domain-containing protein [Ralstonia sp. B265]
MLIVHEGLPGAGKTWEAVVKRLIPALQKGRKVFARINGLDHEKIAEVAGLEVAQVNELLHEIPEAEVLRWNELVENDSLVILDEAQNFWPHGNSRAMGQNQIKAIAEHRHRGLDVVLMCQVLQGAGGVHPVWVNRVDQKIVFEKMNARGNDKKYKWTAYKGQHNGTKIKFTEINKGSEVYDPKYFGCYKSHQDDTSNTETYKDARTNVWNNPVLRKFAPAMLICAGVAVWYLWHAFKGGGLEKSLGGHKVEKTVTVTSTPPAPTSASGVQVSAAQPQPPAGKSAPVSEAQKQDAMADDYVATISQKWRPRLSGLVWGAKGARLVVEWYDESFRLKERFSAAQLEEFGWGVARSAYGEHIILSKGGVHIAVTSWPMESFGKVSEADSRAIASQSSGGVPGFGPSDWHRDEGVSAGGGSVVSRDSGSDWPGYGADGLVKHAKPVRSILTSG